VQIRLIMLAPQAMGETAVALLNTFPLFAVMLRIKEPSRIPGGIRFTLQATGRSGSQALKLEVCRRPWWISSSI
jgi:phosphatidylinositol glycan class Q protein